MQKKEKSNFGLTGSETGSGFTLFEAQFDKIQKQQRWHKAARKGKTKLQPQQPETMELNTC